MRKKLQIVSGQENKRLGISLEREKECVQKKGLLHFESIQDRPMIVPERSLILFCLDISWKVNEGNNVEIFRLLFFEKAAV